MFLTKKELQETIKYSASQIARFENKDSRYYDLNFPKRVKYGRRWVYLKKEVVAWLLQRLNADTDTL